MGKYHMMDDEEKLVRSKQLEEYIFDLSQQLCEGNDELIEKWSAKIKEIYKGRYRHSYSTFFGILNKIHEEGQEFSADYLFLNLDLILYHIEKELKEEHRKLEDLDGDAQRLISKYNEQQKLIFELEYVYSSLYKLRDHINLEESRLAEHRATKDTLANLQKENEKLKTELSAAREELADISETTENITRESNKHSKMLKRSTRDLEDARKKIDRAQIDSVAVLGIFSTVVFAFSGGMTILGNVLSLMNRTAISKPTFYILLTGMILLNVLAVVVNSISNIIGLKRKQIDEEVEAACESDIQSADMTRNGFWKRLCSEHPVVVFGNIVLLLLMTVNIVLWWWDINCYSRFPFA